MKSMQNYEIFFILSNLQSYSLSLNKLIADFEPK
jgi:hypothetical protein